MLSDIPPSTAERPLPALAFDRADAIEGDHGIGDERPAGLDDQARRGENALLEAASTRPRTGRERRQRQQRLSFVYVTPKPPPMSMTPVRTRRLVRARRADRAACPPPRRTAPGEAPASRCAHAGPRTAARKECASRTTSGAQLQRRAELRSHGAGLDRRVGAGLDLGNDADQHRLHEPAGSRDPVEPLELLRVVDDDEAAPADTANSSSRSDLLLPCRTT